MRVPRELGTIQGRKVYGFLVVDELEREIGEFKCHNAAEALRLARDQSDFVFSPDPDCGWPSFGTMNRYSWEIWYTPQPPWMPPDPASEWRAEEGGFLAP